jgi:opacity protein-like surface antigen
MKKIVVLIALSFVLLVRNGFAQDAVPEAAAMQAHGSGRSGSVHTNELGIWTGYSGDNPTWVGRSTGRPLWSVNVQYSRFLYASDGWVLKYSPNVMSCTVVRQPRFVTVTTGGHTETVPAHGEKQTVSGIGLAPIGFQMNFLTGSMVQPFVMGSVGLVYFSDYVPEPRSSRLNATLALGAGLQIWFAQNRSVTLGYQYHHISNAYTQPKNPGLDSNLAYAGYSWSWQDKAAR